MPEYHLAKRHLAAAIRQYDRLVQNPNRLRVSSRFGQVELNRLVRDQMAATHRLADALRSLKLYSEADSYYDDVIEAYPTDLRTLADRSKTYCQAQNWQRAIEYTQERLMAHPIGQWAAVPNLCLGWAISGGLCSWEQRFARWRRRWWHVIRRKADRSNDAALYFDTAIETLDYALLIRPRRILRWQQTNWLPFVEKAARLLNKSNGHNRSEQESIALDDPNLPLNKLNWLYWRGTSFDAEWNNTIQNGQSARIMDDAGQSPLEPVGAEILDKQLDSGHWVHIHLAALKKGRHRVVDLLRQIDKSRKLNNLDHTWSRLDIAMDLFRDWRKAHSDLKKDIIGKVGKSVYQSLGIRMVMDIYAELTVLTVRMLSDAHSFAYALEVAKQGLTMIEGQLGHNWYTDWTPLSANSRTPSGRVSSDSLLSRKTLAHQVATLYAWRAYLLYQSSLDIPTKSYLEYRNQQDKIQSLVEVRDEIESLCKKALEIRPQHTLAVFVQTLLFQHDDLLGHAADHLHRLLDELGYFDPFLYSALYIADWEAQRVMEDPTP